MLPGFVLTKLLATAGSVGLLLAMAYLLMRMLLVAVGTAISLVPAVIVLGFMLFIFRIMLFGSGRRERPRSEHERSVLGLMGKVIAALLRAAVEILGRGASMGGSSENAIAEVRRFRLVGAGGSPIDCELLGEIRGPALRQGDDVQVFGRLQRNGTVRARKVVLVKTGAVVTVRLPVAFVATRVIALAGLSVAVLIAVLAATYYA